MNDNRKWSDAEVERARDFLAECVVELGDEFVPFFSIVERELEQRRVRGSAVERARQIAATRRMAA